MEQLKAENVALKAKIKGLEYENQMYKKLLDNLFLNGNQGSSQMPSFTKHCNVAKQEEIPEHQGLNYQSNKASTNRVEVFNAADLEIDYDYYLDQEDAIEDEAYLKRRNMKKLAQELKEEEELKPIVEDADLKLSEMAQLFGESGAHEILSLETEMQMNFEKLRDQKDAQLWPCLPLNMKF